MASSSGSALSGEPEQQLTEEQINEYKEVFSLFDEDGDGMISIDELDIALKSMTSMSPAGRQDVLDLANAEGNGTVDFQLFLKLTMPKKSIDPGEELRDALLLIDKDRSGFVSAEELRQAMKNVHNLTDEEADEMMQLANINADGRVNYEEFVTRLVSC